MSAKSSIYYFYRVPEDRTVLENIIAFWGTNLVVAVPEERCAPKFLIR